MDSDLFRDIEELSEEDNKMMDPIQREEEEEDIVDGLKYQDLDRRLNDFNQRIEDDGGDGDSYILECNSLMAEIDDEIVIIDKGIRDNYRLRFPELESLVPNPIDYARVVQKIGNETIDVVDLHGLVPPTVTIAGSMITASTGRIVLPQQLVQRTMDSCDRVVRLDSTKQRLVEFIETRMPLIAPNLSAIIGSRVAAKLTGAVDVDGGISSLPMAACNLQLLERILAGFCLGRNTIRHLEDTDIFQMTPPSLKARAGRLLAAKCALAARLDCMKGDPVGKTGLQMRKKILKKMDKWQQPKLPIRYSRKKRGAVTKDRYKMTEMRKLAISECLLEW